MSTTKLVSNGKPVNEDPPDTRPSVSEVHSAITQEYLARLKLQDAEAAAFELLCAKHKGHTVTRIKSLVHAQTTDYRRRWEQKRRDLIVVYYRANGQLPSILDNHAV